MPLHIPIMIDFWKARDPRQYLKNVTPAVMTVGGWFDAEDLYGALHTYEAIEKQNPQLSEELPWLWDPGHMASGLFGKANNLGNIYWGLDANEKFRNLKRNFLIIILREKEDPEYPEATIFVTGSNEWRNFETWPPKNVSEKSLYFHPGKLHHFSHLQLKNSHLMNMFLIP